MLPIACRKAWIVDKRTILTPQDHLLLAIVGHPTHPRSAGDDGSLYSVPRGYNWDTWGFLN